MLYKNIYVIFRTAQTLITNYTDGYTVVNTLRVRIFSFAPGAISLRHATAKLSVLLSLALKKEHSDGILTSKYC